MSGDVGMPYRAEGSWVELHRAPPSHVAWRLLGIAVSSVVLSVLAPGVVFILPWVPWMRVTSPEHPIAIGSAIGTLAFGGGAASLAGTLAFRWLVDLLAAPLIITGSIERVSRGRRPFFVVGEHRSNVPIEIAGALAKHDRVRLTLSRGTKSLVRLERSRVL